MSKEFSIVASGGNFFSNLGEEVHNKLGRAFEKATLDIAANAQANAPVRTGNLKNSIQPDISNAQEYLTGEVEALADYAFYVEMGTHNAPAQPYMSPAVQLVAPPFLRTCQKIVKDSMAGK